MKHKSGGSKAASMLEFALVVPLILFFILLMVGYCIYFFIRNSIDHATKQAAALATTMPGLDRTGVDANGEPNNKASVEKLIKLYKDVNQKPVLPTLLVSTGLIKNYEIEFVPPEGWETDADAYKKNPFAVNIKAEYAGLTPFLAFVPRNVNSTGRAFREYQENSTLPLPVDCLGNPIFPDSPPVPQSLCPCNNSNDPLKRAIPGDESKCTCPVSFLMACYVGNQKICNSADADCEYPLEGTCRCIDSVNQQFNSRTGKCECPSGKYFNSDSQKCECNPCSEGVLSDDGSCACQACTNVCPAGTLRMPGSCDCACNINNSGNKIIRVDGACICDPAERERCYQTEGNIFYGIWTRSDNGKLGGCFCVTCDNVSSLDNNDFYNPNTEKNKCECDIRLNQPGGLDAHCKSLNREVDQANCKCKDICSTDQQRTENCTCNVTSEYCQARGEGNADPTFCRCMGKCEFTPPPPGVTSVPIPAPNCNCDRDRLAQFCSGNPSDHSKNHPVYCTCRCTDPNPANCGPCDPYAWVDNCANKPVGNPLGLPFDWNLYNSQKICACASGLCTGDTILNPATGKCICDPVKVNQKCGNLPVKQILQADGSIECSCQASCAELADNIDGTCQCITGNTTEEKNASRQAKIALCKGMDPPRAFDEANCSCGQVVNFPRVVSSQTGQCTCSLLNFISVPGRIEYLKECLLDNGFINTTTCSCSKTCTANQISAFTSCQACPEGQIPLFCNNASPARYVCAPESCRGNALCTCDGYAFTNPARGENRVNP